MGIRSTVNRGLERSKQLVEEVEDRLNTPRARERRNLQDLEAQRVIEEARKQRREDSARRFPETVEAFGGRVALVTNFGAQSQAESIGSRVAGILDERGFAAADFVVVDGMISPQLTNRLGEFDRSREILHEKMRGLMPETKFSSNKRFLEETDLGLTLGYLGERLDRTIAFRDEYRPGANLGFVAVVSAFDIGPVYSDERYGLAPYAEEAYQKIRFGGGILMPDDSNSGWEQVVTNQ